MRYCRPSGGAAARLGSPCFLPYCVRGGTMRTLQIVHIGGDVVTVIPAHAFNAEEKVRVGDVYCAATVVDGDRLQLSASLELGGTLSIGRTKMTMAGEQFLSEAEELQRIQDSQVVVPTTYVISSVAFLDRFTQAERLAVHAAAAQSPVLDDFRILCCAAGEIDLLSERVQQAMAFLVAGGLLTQARADAIVSLT